MNFEIRQCEPDILDRVGSVLGGCEIHQLMTFKGSQIIYDISEETDILRGNKDFDGFGLHFYGGDYERTRRAMKLLGTGTNLRPVTFFALRTYEQDTERQKDDQSQENIDLGEAIFHFKVPFLEG